MANLTITVDEDTLKRARIRAIEDGTSVNVVLREFLESWARPPAAAPGEDFSALARRASGASGPRGRRWARDDLHDR
jgi:plasmid stability protein